MAVDLKTWLKSVDWLSKKSLNELSTIYAFRDPMRRNLRDRDYFFSPADGTIIYQKIVKNPKNKILEVKGNKFTLQELLGDDEYTQPSLVIGIFMTFYDVHINRIPYAGFLDYEFVDPIKSGNLPMLAVEENIFEGHVNYDKAMINYLKTNERVINEIFSPLLNYKYYVIQIADQDINCIMPFNNGQDVYLHQNQRFSFVRWGSQVDLVLPLDKNLKFDFCCKTLDHVEAGKDKLVKITHKKKLF